MTKIEFLKLLKMELESGGVKNIQEILSDYEEHFSHGLSKGKSEEEISKNLGSPLTLAKAYKTESLIREIKDTENDFSLKLALNIVIRLLVLAPFNLIILFIPGIIIFGILTGGWGATIGIGGAAVGILGFLPQIMSVSTSVWPLLTGVSVFISLAGSSMLMGIIMYTISKFIFMGLISYLQWNLKFILDK